MNLLLWSFHIRDVGVDGLKQISHSGEQATAILQKLIKELSAKECFYLPTCNRVEFLFLSDKPFEKKPRFTNLKPKIFSETDKIVEHLLEVACSMDSVVFGENQILGQIKSAFTEQQKSNLVGPGLSKILNLVLREAKKIRTETQLSRLQTSVSSVAAKNIQQKFKGKASVLMVGYGETHKLLHKSLEKKNFKNITITNRTSSKLDELTSVEKVPWNDFLKADISHVDIISFATSSEKTLLTKEMLEKAKPKLVIDLCMPPNADHKLVKKQKCEYLGLNELQKIVSKDKREAVKIKKELKNYIVKSVSNILADLSVQSINSLITENIEKSMKIHEEALSEEIESFLGPLTLEQKTGLAQWSGKLIKKINHIHLKTYKDVVSIKHTKKEKNPRT